MTKKFLCFDFDGTLVNSTLIKTIDTNQISTALNISQESLQKVSSKYNLGIISGGSQSEVFSIVEKTYLNLFFDKKYIITKECTSKDKISGEPFILAKKQISNDYIFIGDSRSDEIGCIKANVTCYLMQNNSKVDLEKLIKLLTDQI